MAIDTIDQARTEAFVGRVFGDLSATLTSIMAAIGDRHGLFKELAASGPATSLELAARAGIAERYAREWLGGMASAGYLEHDAATGRFTLPPEHAPALAQEGGPAFFGGVYNQMLDSFPVIDRVVEAFKHGRGVPQSAFPDGFYAGMERFSAGWFENRLLQQWIPAMPEVEARLARGARLADVGCGSGRALIKLAQAFPESRFVGYELHGPNVDRATANVRAAGLADRVRMEQTDAVRGLPEAEYDVVCTFDVVHDAAAPLELLRAIRRSLRPDGVYVCLEMNCSHDLDANAGPFGAMLHGISIVYCTSVSLANGGEALGTLGLHEPRLRELCAAAGFGPVHRVGIQDPFNALYEIKA
jgi:SAM-dependent methyltransferase